MCQAVINSLHETFWQLFPVSQLGIGSLARIFEQLLQIIGDGGGVGEGEEKSGQNICNIEKLISKIKPPFPWISLSIHCLFLFWEAVLLSSQPLKKAWGYPQFLTLPPHGKPCEDCQPGCLSCLSPVLSLGPMSTPRALSHEESLY